MIEKISGGVCAALGFKANGIHCGVRKNQAKKDIALVVCDVKCAAAAVYTKNLVKGAPIYVTRDNIADGYAQAIICNSGNANTCNADGIDVAKRMCGYVQEFTGISAGDVIIGSTGVIGQKLDTTPIYAGMQALSGGLNRQGASDAAQAIMTTDTAQKEIACEFVIGGKTCKMGGMAKGSGMIHPNMATMLVFITTDAAIAPDMLQKALSQDVCDSFNMISVDGDTSTNDMVSVMASDLAANPVIDKEGADFDAFKEALAFVTTNLCMAIAKDGEGATKRLECICSGALDKQTARVVAKSVICSTLFKAAMFGSDANWGRVLCAIGYSGADVDVNRISVSFASRAGTVAVCENGAGIDFSEDEAKKILSLDEITILVGLNDGQYSATAWGCDLTYDYVKINGDYRS